MTDHANGQKTPGPGGGGGAAPQPPGTPTSTGPVVDGINLSELRPAELVEMGSKGGVFQCPLCKKTFGYKNGLMRHIRLTHVGEKPYQCNICQRRFGYKHILMEHQNLHFGNRPYACTLCDKRFAARSNLIQHRLVHKKPFNCSLCSKRFDREDQLKKHLFAHPQSLLTCNVCKYAAASQADLNRHMVERHHPQVIDTRPTVRRGSTETPDPPGQQNVEPITPPSESPTSTNPSGSLPTDQQSPHGARQRIDDIASHLCAAAARAGQPQLCNIVVKQEVDENLPDSACADRGRPMVTSVNGVENLSTTGAGETDGRRTADDILAHEISRYEDPHRRTVDTPVRQPFFGGVGQAYGPPGGAGIPGLGHIPATIDAASHELAQGAALPAIHELFSRRSQRVMPTFTSFPPPMITENRLAMPGPAQEMPNPMLSPPTSSLPSCMPSPAPVTSRPTAQLPPITQVLRQTKEAGVQHAAPMPGIPDLEDVISYYMSQGKLFRCQYCNIVFFERGMFFLHASLHGPSNPWECSICHKVCSDKNEFTLHFVNQQHT